MLRGRPVLSHTVAAFDSHPGIGEIVIVRNADAEALYDACGIETALPLRVVDWRGGRAMPPSARGWTPFRGRSRWC
jgi:2-C-methyl-D-erythritol 4-phosphate cytidylyltransferase